MLVARSVKYYLAKEYYVEAQDNKGIWRGKGAEKLGLSGEIKAEDYLRILRGRSPHHEKEFLMGRKVNVEKRCSGTDFVFCAPKSVSLQALIMQDAQVRLAHWLAVQAAIAQLEKRAKSFVYQGRYGIDRRRCVIETGNVIVACFEHIESRPTWIKGEPMISENPHLHTHCLVMNLTQLPNGKWRSLVNRDIFHHLREIRQIYHNNLRDKLEELGFPLRKEGFWVEIDTYSREIIEAFSSRNQAIRRLREEEGSESISEFDLWAFTRGSKKNRSEEEYLEEWKLKMDSINNDYLFAQTQAEMSRFFAEITNSLVTEAILNEINEHEL